MSVLCVCSLNVDVSRGDMVSVLSADQQLYAEWIVLPDAITELFAQLFFSDRFWHLLRFLSGDLVSRLTLGARIRY